MTEQRKVTVIDPGTILRRKNGKLRYHASFQVEAASGERGTRANQAPDVDPNLFGGDGERPPAESAPESSERDVR